MDLDREKIAVTAEVARGKLPKVLKANGMVHEGLVAWADIQGVEEATAFFNLLGYL